MAISPFEFDDEGALAFAQNWTGNQGQPEGQFDDDGALQFATKYVRDQGWNTESEIDPTLEGLRGAKRGIETMVPFAGSTVTSPIEEAPAPNVPGAGIARFAAPVAQSFGEGAIGSVAGPLGVAGAAGYGEILRQAKDHRLDAIRAGQPDPGVAGGYEALDGGDALMGAGAAVLGGVGAKIGQFLNGKMIAQAKELAAAGQAVVPALQIAKTAAPQIGYDVMSGGAMAAGEMANEGQDIDSLEALRQAAISGAMSAGGQALGVRNTARRLRNIEAGTDAIEAPAPQPQISRPVEQPQLEAPKLSIGEEIGPAPLQMEPAPVQVDNRPIDVKEPTSSGGVRQWIADTLHPERRKDIDRLTAERDQARREADENPKTELPGERAWLRAKPAIDADEDVSVGSYDLNNFKALNDRYGHTAGDRMITEAGHTVRDIAKSIDTHLRVFHPHGDEFVVAGPTASVERFNAELPAIFGQRGPSDAPVGISGAIGKTFDEADGNLQQAKADSKGISLAQQLAGRKKIEVEEAQAQPAPESGVINSGGEGVSMSMDAPAPKQGKAQELQPDDYNPEKLTHPVYDAPSSLNDPDIPAIKPFEQPEIIQLYKDTFGDVPTVRKLPEDKHGFFKYKENEMQVVMNALKSGDTNEANRTLGHELFHFLDYAYTHGSKEKTMAKGGVSRRILSEAKTVKDSISGAMKYASKLPAEFNERALRRQMHALSQELRPYDPAADTKYDKYRKQSNELYADFGSALITNPGLARRFAPDVYDLFFKYMDRKPPAKAAYQNLQKLLNRSDADIAASRDTNVEAMFEKGAEARTTLQEQTELERGEYSKVGNQLAHWLDDVRHPIMKMVQKVSGGKFNPQYTRVRNAQERVTLNNDKALLSHDLKTQVEDVLKQQGHRLSTLGKVMFYEQIIHNRHDSKGDEIFNPLGITRDIAVKQMQHLSDKMGADKLKQVQDAASKARELIFDQAIEAAYKEGLLTKKQYDLFSERRDTYGRMAVVKYMTDNMSAVQRRQIGTFRDVEDVYGSTVLQGFAIQDWVKSNAAKRVFAEEMLKAKAVKPATARNVKETNEEGQVRNRTKFDQPAVGGLVEYYKNGERKAVKVSKLIADAFDHQPAEMAQSFAAGLRLANKPFRALYTKYSPVFQLWSSGLRDIPESMKNIAVGHGVSKWEFAKETYNQFKTDAKDWVDGNISNPAVRQALNESIAGLPKDSVFWDDGGTDTAREFKARVGMTKSKLGDAEGAVQRAADIKGVRQVLSAIEKLPKFGERLNIAQKLAASKLLKQKGVDDNSRITFARNYISNPNTRVQGAFTPIGNELYLYANVIQKGMKRNLDLIQKDPKAYAKNWAQVNLPAKVIMMAAAGGLLGKAAEEWIDGFPEFDKANMIILPIPPFVSHDKNGKPISHGLRIPMDDPGRMLTGLMWKTGNAFLNAGDAEGWMKLMDFAGGVLPGKSPIAKIPIAWSQYSVGLNPKDDFTGQPILTRDEHAARGSDALAKMFEWSIQQMGLRNLANVKDGSIYPFGYDRIIRSTRAGHEEQQHRAIDLKQRESARRAIQAKRVREEFNSGNSDAVKKAVESGKISERQGRNIEKEVGLSPAQRRIRRLPEKQRLELEGTL